MSEDSKLKRGWLGLNEGLARIGSSLVDPVLLLIRFYWGWQFFLTGKGKLMNLDGTAEFFGELGLPLPKFQAMMAGGVECVGGLLLLAGLCSRLAALPLIVVMMVAYATAHVEELKGMFSDSDAFVTAAPFLFLLASVLVFVFGPGRYSADVLLLKSRRA
ncbi:DoxX family protein [Phragmitibacter flavus]|uniref:DoxX family protein n=1 Tax=Phragmitibacter flavus TaxID=2576071 RepID=A0A5R8KC19_9BACT|nr:DoxX family protein [Phragmitibacter flavus]TLD69777.1 DoxX family protein [Phragmitibacter flavus]